MQLRHSKTILPPADTIQKVSSLAWSPNNGKLAAVTTDKVVHLFDEAGERKDKFKTKAADANGSGMYQVRAMAFSPDSTKLAIAQSDNIVFVYRLGEGWTDKKSICNKFVQSSAVTCLAWPAERHNEIVFGLADGKVKLGMLKSNKTYTMYTHPDGSYVTSMAASTNGKAVVSGHLDGSMYKFSFPEEGEEAAGSVGHSLLGTHSVAPYALGWGESIAAAGSDCKISFYDPISGRELQTFDLSLDPSVRDLCSCAFNPSGDSAAFGAFDRIFVFALNEQRGGWEQVAVKQVENFYTVTALSWKPDGSRLAAGSLTGAVDVWDACIRRARYRNKFEFTYVSKSSVIVKTLATGARIVLKSVYGYDVGGLNIYQDRFIVARTPSTLLLGDLGSARLSEVAWEDDGTEKFYFENEKVCMLYRGGELSLVEYGRNEVLGVCRTEYMSPYLISVVIREARGAAGQEARKVAYLVDAQTIRITDLAGGAGGADGASSWGGNSATIAHDARIDWLELNPRGTHVLFRDKRRQLHLYHLARQEKTTLLTFCQYVQWVPGSDVVVAQSRGNLCVWYNINSPDRVTMIPIKGEVETIERLPGKTEVLVDEGLATAVYTLDENLIDFGAALEELDFERAVDTLEPLELTPETEAQWSALAAAALEAEALSTAERCYAALGDVAKARFLHKVVKLANAVPASDAGDAASNSIAAQLAVLSKQWPVAESLLLAHGKVDEAIGLYQQCHRWDDAVRVADAARHPQADALKKEHYAWLLQTAQEGKAGQVKERGGDPLGAISFYLKAGLPAKAAAVVTSTQRPGAAVSGPAGYDAALLDSICASLAQAGLHERSGELLEQLGRQQEALQAYRKGRAYRRAVALSRQIAPATVIALEEEWGDWLATQRQMDAAINHFIEAGCTIKAIEAAMAARQFAKAAGILEHVEPPKAAPYFRNIAQHYEASGSLEEAERYWLRADAPMEAVEMYNRAGKWEAAQKVARGYLPDGVLQRFYTQRAKEFEGGRKWKEAERAYLAAEDADGAIAMYKRARMWEPMLKLVAQHRKAGLQQAHLLVGEALQAEGQLREAERHLCEAKDWKAAVQMHRNAGAWEDALRVAKVFGGIAASKQVAYAWASSLGAEAGGALLKRQGLADAAIDFALESGAFEQAYQFAQVAAPVKLPEVHLKTAMYLEDEGRYAEAEQHFVAAGKPREAIDMYVHTQDWEAALRVAQNNDAGAATDIFVAQARALAATRQYGMAEGVFLRAKRPEGALAMYREAGQWADALRIAEAYLPSKVAEVHMEMAQGAAGNTGGGDGLLARARAFERNNDYARAIEAYLELGPQDSSSADALQQAWESAVALAARHQRHRLAEVAGAAAERLLGIGRAAAAGELLEGAGDLPGAIQAYCAGGLHDRARALAGGAPALLRIVEQSHTAALVANNDGDALAAKGSGGEAVEMYAAKGQWDKAHEVAAKTSPEAAAALAARHARLLLKQQDTRGAAAVLAKHGVAADAAHIDCYRAVALGVLGASLAERDEQAESDLRDALQRVVQQLDSSAPSAVRKGDADDVRRMHQAAHYTALASRARSAGLAALAAKQLTAALRYVGIIPADRAFYEAGVAWKEAGLASMAFVLLNRFLDLEDAMEDSRNAGKPASNAIENGDFVSTDIPFDFMIPQRHYADDDQREEVRSYVLEISMDQAVEQSLAARTCEHCGASTYEAGLSCTSCNHVWDACAISGYPVVQGERIMPRPGLVARRGDWNAWVAKFQADPITGAPAAPVY